MSHRRIHNTATVTTAHGKTARTMQGFKEGFKEGYDVGYNACMLELEQLIGPEHGSIDAVVHHLESYVQQKNRERTLKSNITARQ